MRTTVTLDADVRAMIGRVMRERGLSFKEALNSAVRSGLATPNGGGRRGGFKLKTVSMGVPRVDLTKALALADAMEDEEIIRKMAVRK